MPISPLTRLLLALAVLAFVPAFIWLEDEGKVAQTMTGTAISLLVAAVFSMMRDNPPLGDRAFHRTRPHGNARTFRRLTVTLGLLVIGVSLMAAARSGYHHLGSEVALRSMAITCGYLGLVVGALAVGFVLASDRSGSPRRIAVVMIALPVVVFLLIHESRSLGTWLAVRGPRQDWTMRISWAVAVGLMGFGGAWWLAARSFRPRLALAVAGLTAAALPVLHLRGDLWPMPSGPLPDVPVTLSRGPKVEHTVPDTLEEPRNPLLMPLYLPLEGRIAVSGLRSDEFMSLKKLSPKARVAQGYRSKGGSGWGGGHGLLVDGGDFQVLFQRLPNLVAGHPALVLDRYQQHTGNWVAIEKKQAVVDEFESQAWTLDETVFKIEHAGKFPAARGGFGTIPSGGSIRVFPAHVNALGVVFRFRLVLPGEDTEKTWDDRSVRVLLVDESTGRAWMPQASKAYPGVPRAWGLASHWQNWTVEPPLADFPGLSTEVALRCTLHVFTSRPVGKVRATVPAP